MEAHIYIRDRLVKVVVAKTMDDMVLKSGKDVLIEVSSIIYSFIVVVMNSHDMC